MKKYLPVIVTCCIVIPLAVVIGLLAGARFGRLSGVVGLFAILLVASYSRKLSSNKLER